MKERTIEIRCFCRAYLLVLALVSHGCSGNDYVHHLKKGEIKIGILEDTLIKKHLSFKHHSKKFLVLQSICLTFSRKIWAHEG